MTKVLLSAYACEPYSGSEEGVGWNVVNQVAKLFSVWVLTRTFYRSTIETELKKILNIIFTLFILIP